MKKLRADRCDTPLGKILLLADDDGALCYLDFAENEKRLQKLLAVRYGGVSFVKAELRDLRARVKRYFAGDWNAFDGADLRTDGTAFQRKVWRALQKIPAGKTLSYAQLAKSIGMPKAARAVGNANARNPIAVVIPCHRVICADGTVGGYGGGYGGGLARKSWLLEHEGAREKCGKSPFDRAGTEERT